jgi:hypothetical protein
MATFPHLPIELWINILRFAHGPWLSKQQVSLQVCSSDLDDVPFPSSPPVAVFALGNLAS